MIMMMPMMKNFKEYIVSLVTSLAFLKLENSYHTYSLLKVNIIICTKYRLVQQYDKVQYTYSCDRRRTLKCFDFPVGIKLII